MLDKGLCLFVFLAFLHHVEGQGLCFDVIQASNISYRYHPDDCNQYIQCHARPESGETIAVYRACPYGYYWNQALLECDRSDAVNCPIERCFGSDTPIEGSGCRAFWRCQNGFNTAACCEPGYRYVRNVGCSPDFTCMNPCPGPCGISDVCRSFPHWDKIDYFYHRYNDQSVERICPIGTAFDILECGCVSRKQDCNPTHFLDFLDAFALQIARNDWLNDNIIVSAGQAIFGPGSSFFVNTQQPKPSLTEPLVIMFRYKETFPASAVTRNMLYSDDCKRCNRLTVDLVANTVEVTLLKFNKQVAQVAVSTEGFNTNDWKETIVMYTGREILLIVRAGSLSYMKRTEAPRLNIMDCGMYFGSDGQQPFNGFLSFFAIFSCNPKGRVIDLLQSFA